MMKPKKAQSLMRDVVEYSPPSPHGKVQALALSRIQSTLQPEPEPPPLYTTQEIMDFAVRWITEHGRTSAQEICRELYGSVNDSTLRTVGNCLALRKRLVGDLSYSRVRTKVPGEARTLWFLVQPVTGVSLKDMDARLARMEDQLPMLVKLLPSASRLARIEAQQKRILRILEAVFRCGEWPA